jgi:hypothetical protein
MIHQICLKIENGNLDLKIWFILVCKKILIKGECGKSEINRLTATELLKKHRSFFKKRKDDEYVKKHLLSGLPNLEDRVRLELKT